MFNRAKSRFLENFAQIVIKNLRHLNQICKHVNEILLYPFQRQISKFSVIETFFNSPILIVFKNTSYKKSFSVFK